jgi:hypothetical protein
MMVLLLARLGFERVQLGEEIGVSEEIVLLGLLLRLGRLDRDGRGDNGGRLLVPSRPDPADRGPAGAGQGVADRGGPGGPTRS